VSVNLSGNFLTNRGVNFDFKTAISLKKIDKKEKLFFTK